MDRLLLVWKCTFVCLTILDIVVMSLGNLFGWTNNNDTVLVDTRLGAIRGTKLKNKNGETIFSFRGVPYGKPPVGPLRFRRSEPVSPWRGEWDGTEEAQKPLQPNVLFPDYHLLRSREDWIILCCTVLYCIILYCTILYCAQIRRGGLSLPQCLLCR